MFQFFGTRIRISDACKDKNNFENSLEQFKLSYILRNRLILQGKMIRHAWTEKIRHCAENSLCNEAISAAWMSYERYSTLIFNVTILLPESLHGIHLNCF